MKKILSVLLAVMMLFGALSVGASAATDLTYSQIYGTQLGKPLANKETQVVLSFDFNGGKNMVDLVYYDTQYGWTSAAAGKYTGTYYMLPVSEITQKPGHQVSLPRVTPPSGYTFDGWYCYYDGQTYSPAGNYTIPAMQGQVVSFRAAFVPAEVEADTMDTIMGVLTKVFGAVIGIMMYGGDTAAGVAMMDKVLGGILG